MIIGNSEVHTLPYPDGVVLPNGYKRCEYLKSDGAAYIELPFGFYPTDEVYAKVKFDIIYSDERHIITTRYWNTNQNRFCFAVYNLDFAAALGNVATPNGRFTPNVPCNKSVCEVSYRNKQFTLLNEGNTFVCDLNNANFGSESTYVCLLKNYDSNGTKGYIYEYRHKKDNTEYRLIPCLDSNDTPCMYDVINNQAYYNSAGSSSFTYKLYPQPTEIWSCGEYNPTDGKYHILVQPLEGSIADIALNEPLRKVNDVADTIEFPSDTEGKALVTRVLKEDNITSSGSNMAKNSNSDFYRMIFHNYPDKKLNNIVFMAEYTTEKNPYGNQDKGMACSVTSQNISLYDERFNQADSKDAFREYLKDAKVIYELATPATELVDAPQIEEAEGYTCEISQGGRAVSWSSFETNSE